jgi:hypothetical protein
VYTKRHDAVLDIIVKYLTERYNAKGDQLKVNKSVFSSASKLRPDIILNEGHDKIKKLKDIYLVDVKVPAPFSPTTESGEEINFVTRSNNNNIKKYEILVQQLHYRMGCKVHNLTLVVPSIGPVPKLLLDNLRILGFNSTKAKMIIKELVIAVSNSNYEILCPPSSSSLTAIPDEPVLPNELFEPNEELFHHSEEEF